MIVTVGVTEKLAISNVPQVIPSNTYVLIYSPVMKSFRRKKTPTKSREVIKKLVGTLDLIVRNFNNGLAIIMVKVRISNVAIKYKDVVGSTIPLLNRPITK